MIKNNIELKQFFESDIFDIDEDEVVSILSRFNEDEVFICMADRIETASASDDEIEETPWKLGRVFAVYETLDADKYIIDKLPNFDLRMTRSCMSFLSGYWDDAAPQVDSLKIFFRMLVKSINEQSWNQKLLSTCVETAAVVFANNRLIFCEDDFLNDSFSVVRDYGLKVVGDYPGKKLLYEV